MGYKWRPSKSQRKEFAIRMQNPDEKAAYEQRKEERAQRRRSTSSFDYNTAGGNYVPTQSQYDFVMNHMYLFNTSEEQDAVNQIIYGYTCKEKVFHDYIHIINEKRRTILI